MTELNRPWQVCRNSTHCKTQNFREHLIFAHICEGIARDGGWGHAWRTLNDHDFLIYGPIFKI